MRHRTAAPRGAVRTAVAVSILAVLSSASPAAAHPSVDEGRRLVDQADFDAAERAFAEAEAATDLSRAELIALLEGRALLHHALADTAALEADLARLAAIDPDHAFGAGLPPELAAAFLRVRTRSTGPLRLRLDIREVPGGLALRAAADNDPAGLVRTLEVYGRLSGQPWRSAADELVLTAAPGTSVEAWARARGPGGAVVAERGSESEPVGAVVPGAVQAVGSTADGTGVTARPRRSRTVWPFIAVGAGVVVAVVTAAVLVWTVRSDQTAIGSPDLRGL